MEFKNTQALSWFRTGISLFLLQSSLLTAFLPMTYLLFSPFLFPLLFWSSGNKCGQERVLLQQVVEWQIHFPAEMVYSNEIKYCFRAQLFLQLKLCTVYGAIIINLILPQKFILVQKSTWENARLLCKIFVNST